jgi:hypothetical protein
VIGGEVLDRAGAPRWHPAFAEKPQSTCRPDK